MANAAVCIAHSPKLLELSDLNPRTAGRVTVVCHVLFLFTRIIVFRCTEQASLCTNISIWPPEQSKVAAVDF